MKVFKTVKTIQDYIKLKKCRGSSIGFVPTMGYLHEGHLSLIRRAHKENDISVVSIFVNPTQFGPKEDYKKYPRDFKRDEKLSKQAGADLIFYPKVREIYPEGYRTYVDVKDITGTLCGASRPGHFTGVSTVVAKLFNTVQPDVAYFGQKDAQQAVVIKQMVRDINMDIKIKVMPIVREANGLAMSSRNRYLSAKERIDAPVLYESLKLARRLIKAGVQDVRSIRSQMSRIIRSKGSMRIEYISIVDKDNLKEIKRVKKDALIALAVKVGKTRLIDNIVIKGGI